MYFAERLVRIHRLTVTDSELRFRSILTGQTDRFLPISDPLARLSDEPITNLVLLDTPSVLFVALTGLFVTGFSGRSSLKLGEPSFYDVLIHPTFYVAPHFA